MNDDKDIMSLKDQFLLAMPGLHGSEFANTVTYICGHDELGAMGLIINQPLGVSVDEILEQLEIDSPNHYQGEVLAGGPIDTSRGFILHPPAGSQWESTMKITEEIYLSTSLDIMRAIGEGTGPAKALITLGYAGWGPGQLDEEIAANAWLTMPADTNIIFNTPVEQRLLAASTQLGVDLTLMTSAAGHA